MLLLDGKILNVGHDNGSEFQKHFALARASMGVPQYYSRPKTPKDNAVCERFNRTLQDEFLRLGNFSPHPDRFNRNRTEWLVEYNFQRPHQSLGYVPPINFEAKYLKVLPRYPSIHSLSNSPIPSDNEGKPSASGRTSFHGPSKLHLDRASHRNRRDRRPRGRGRPRPEPGGQILMQSRDGSRVSDMASLYTALQLYTVDPAVNGAVSLGSPNTVYVSLPDPAATSTQGDHCEGLGLLSLPATYTYHCAASSTYRDTDGTGAKGVRALTELERKPVMREFFRK